MSHYQVIARRFRPQKFSEVVGQDEIVQTLKNGIQNHRSSHAYLFCGPRGTGKTSLARIFAKALNCENRIEGEPCNTCASCLEITSSNSLDVIEIDGASNRGIDDIRQLNESVGYCSSKGEYKIYIIDEVHMLTKEAFNALLKTLEEPPKNVKFFFATTEPHKVLATIASRCIRFDLRRIAQEKIRQNLKQVCAELSIPVEDKAIDIVCHKSDGSLRDGQSLMDQLICFGDSPITEDTAIHAFGLIPKHLLQELDQAYETSDLSKAFSLADKIYSAGIDHSYFIETLLWHYRDKLKPYFENKQDPIYSKDKLLYLLEYLTKQLSQKLSFRKVHLEMTFLHIIKSNQRVTIDTLMDQLNALKGSAPKPIKADPKPIESKAPKAIKEINPNAQVMPTMDRSTQVKHDTLIQFACVELNGNLKH